MWFFFYLFLVENRLSNILKESSSIVKIQGRFKSFGSTFTKCRKHDINIDDIQDFIAFRIIHNNDYYSYNWFLFNQLKKIFKFVSGQDFRTFPKKNGYNFINLKFQYYDYIFEIQICTIKDYNYIYSNGKNHYFYKGCCSPINILIHKYM